MLIAAIVLYIGLCGLTVENQLTATQMLHDSRVGVDRQVSGTAARPFVYRRLTADLLEWASQLGLYDHLLQYDPPGFTARETKTCVAPDILIHATCRQVMNLSLVLVVFAIAFAALMHAAFLHLLKSHLLAIAGVLFSIFVNNAIILRGTSQLYDFASLAFSAAMVLTLIKRWKLLFIATLLIGCLNKETTIIFTPIFFLFELFDNKLREGAIYAIIQTIIYAIISIAIHRHFAENTGSVMEIWFHQQPGYYMAYLKIENFSILLFIVLLVFGQLANQSNDIKILTLILPLWGGLMLVGGYPGELRNLTEVLPILLLMSYSNILRILGITIPTDIPAPSER